LIMNGAGNRFAVFDARNQSNFALSEEKVKAICKPGSSVMGEKGADQLIIIRDPKSTGADGNATRCIAWLYMRDEGVDSMVLETNDGLLLCAAAGENQVAVDMGPPKLEWEQIPLKEVMHTHHPVLHNPGAVNMGNPHCVFFVEDFEQAKPTKVGPMIEFHPLFPEQVNVGFAKIEGKDKIRLKVWERGVGMTLACGTGACAAVVAAVRQKRTDRKVEVEVDGGTLFIEWREGDDHVIMIGPVKLESEGSI